MHAVLDASSPSSMYLPCTATRQLNVTAKLDLQQHQTFAFCTPYKLLLGWLVQGSVLYDRLRESCEQGVPGAAGPAMAIAHLTAQDRDKLRRPSFLVLCSPSGLPVEALMQQLTALHPSSVGRVVTHSSRTPLVICSLHLKTVLLAKRHSSIKLCSLRSSSL